MLFEITADKQNYTPSWLLGTMHLRNEAAFAYLEKAQPYIEKSASYVGEMNLDEAAAAQFSMAEINISTLDYMSQKHFDKLAQVVEKQLGIKLSFFSNYPPLFVYNLIAEGIFAKDKSVSLDQYLWNSAKNAGKTMYGLESFQHQIDILHALPPDLYIRSLKKMSTNFAQFRKGLLKSATLYQQGNLRQLHKLALKGNSKTKKVLVYDRNVHMANRIEELMVNSTDPVFFAFGAGHFLGQKGVFRLLKKKGFSIKAV